MFSQSFKNFKGKFFKLKATSLESAAEYFLRSSTQEPQFPLWWSHPSRFTSVLDDLLSVKEGRGIELIG